MIRPGPGLLISPKGVIQSEEQKHQFAARCGIECLLKRAAELLGLESPRFVLLPVPTSNNGQKKFVFSFASPKTAKLFGLPPKLPGDNPWDIHAQIGARISAFLEERGKSLTIKK